MNLPITAGEELLADDINRISGIIEQNAGETVNGATLPVACYKDTSDGEWYACDANDDTKLEFQGFAISNGTDGNPIKIQQESKVDGFTGLTVGARYYVQDDKTIGTTPGTYEVLVGIAISATEIFILKGSFQYIGSATDSADSITVPAAARFAVIAITYNNTTDSTQGKAEITLSRVGKTSGTVAFTDLLGAGHGNMSASASWSGSTITLSYAGVADNVEGTAYFYR